MTVEGKGLGDGAVLLVLVPLVPRRGSSSARPGTREAITAGQGTDSGAGSRPVPDPPLAGSMLTDAGMFAISNMRVPVTRPVSSARSRCSTRTRTRIIGCPRPTARRPSVAMNLVMFHHHAPIIHQMIPPGIAEIILANNLKMILVQVLPPPLVLPRTPVRKNMLGQRLSPAIHHARRFEPDFSGTIWTRGRPVHVRAQISKSKASKEIGGIEGRDRERAPVPDDGGTAPGRVRFHGAPALPRFRQRPGGSMNVDEQLDAWWRDFQRLTPDEQRRQTDRMVEQIKERRRQRALARKRAARPSIADYLNERRDRLDFGDDG